MGTHSFLRVAARAAFASVILLGFNPFASAAHAQHSASEAFSTAVEYCVFDTTFPGGDSFGNYIAEAGLTFNRQQNENDGFNTRFYITQDPLVIVARSEFPSEDQSVKIKTCSVAVDGVPDSRTIETMIRIFSNQDGLPDEDQPTYSFDAENIEHRWISKCLGGAIIILPNSFMLYFSSRFREFGDTYYNYCSDHVNDAAGATP